MPGLNRDIREAFAGWLDRGGTRIGQVVVRGRYELLHADDLGREGLEVFDGPAAARAIARDDAGGQFRPLKTAPDLRRGWLLRLADLDEVLLALDALYPAMVGIWAAHRRGDLVPVPLRETLSRQTGMYRAAANIGDAEADALVGATCRCDSQCLKRILWPIAPGRPITSLPAQDLDPEGGEGLPLLCHEACNLLVAAARQTVKGSR